MRHALNKFLSDEERAGTLIIGGVTAVMAVCFVVAVLAVLFL